MQIWVDADACPVMIKEIIYRAANRAKIETTLVANQGLSVPPSRYIKTLQVSQGFDVADDEIALRCQPGDLVVTADIPLAAEVIEKGGNALNPRGELYTKANIRGKLNMRDFMDTMRSSGVQTGGPPPMGNKEKQAFANNLDRLIAKSNRVKI